MDSLAVKLDIWKDIFNSKQHPVVSAEVAAEKAKKIFETLANKNPSEVAQR